MSPDVEHVPPIFVHGRSRSKAIAWVHAHEVNVMDVDFCCGGGEGNACHTSRCLRKGAIWRYLESLSVIGSDLKLWSLLSSDTSWQRPKCQVSTRRLWHWMMTTASCFFRYYDLYIYIYVSKGLIFRETSGWGRLPNLHPWGILSTLLGALSLAIAALLVKVCATALHLGRWVEALAHDLGFLHEMPAADSRCWGVVPGWL